MIITWKVCVLWVKSLSKWPVPLMNVFEISTCGAACGKKKTMNTFNKDLLQQGLEELIYNCFIHKLIDWQTASWGYNKMVRLQTVKPGCKPKASYVTIKGSLNKPWGQRERHQTKGLMSTTKGNLSNPRRRREREQNETKSLMSRTIAVHVRYNSLYISLPSSAKQQRKMTKFCVVYGTWTTTANFSYLCKFSFNALLEPLVYRTDPDNREFRL